MRIARLSTKKEIDEQGPVDLSLIDPLIEKYKGKKGNLIPILQGTQDIFGYIPRVAFEKISSETGLKLSAMYGVATFYAQFRLVRLGNTLLKFVMEPPATFKMPMSLLMPLKKPSRSKMEKQLKMDCSPWNLLPVLDAVPWLL